MMIMCQPVHLFNIKLACLFLYFFIKIAAPTIEIPADTKRSNSKRRDDLATNESHLSCK